MYTFHASAPPPRAARTSSRAINDEQHADAALPSIRHAPEKQRSQTHSHSPERSRCTALAANWFARGEKCLREIERGQAFALSSPCNRFRNGGQLPFATLPGLIVYIIIAAIRGAIGKAIAGGVRGGLIVSIALGCIGAILGPWGGAQASCTNLVMVQVSGHPPGPLVDHRRRSIRSDRPPVLTPKVTAATPHP